MIRKSKLLLSVFVFLILAFLVVAFDNSSDENVTVVNETNDSTSGNQTEEAVSEEPGLLETIISLITDKLSVIKGEIVNIKAHLMYENKPTCLFCRYFVS